MNDSEKVTEKWHVIFCQAKSDNILTPFLEKNFQHVYAMKETEGGYLWHIINSTQSHISLSLVSTDDFPHPRLYAGNDAIILPVTVHIDPRITGFRPCFFSCVEVVKSCLGINSIKIQTPFQLYKHLKGHYYGQRIQQQTKETG